MATVVCEKSSYRPICRLWLASPVACRPLTSDFCRPPLGTGVDKLHQQSDGRNKYNIIYLNNDSNNNGSSQKDQHNKNDVEDWVSKCQRLKVQGCRGRGRRCCADFFVMNHYYLNNNNGGFVVGLTVQACIKGRYKLLD